MISLQKEIERKRQEELDKIISKELEDVSKYRIKYL